NDWQNASRYLVLSGNADVDNASIKALNNLREILAANTSLDIAKYCLPESYKTELSWSVNARSLQNFITLRSSKSALWEIRNLANAIYNALPNEHKFIFAECVYKD
ncbi:MAG: FAD-dependent thymidylate synthase, partial [Campylobacter sp.]